MSIPLGLSSVFQSIPDWLSVLKINHTVELLAHFARRIILQDAGVPRAELRCILQAVPSISFHPYLCPIDSI